MKPKECGFTSPPPEDSPDRERMDAFADWLRILAESPRNADGHIVLPLQAFRYAMGEVDRPCEPT